MKSLDYLYKIKSQHTGFTRKMVIKKKPMWTETRTGQYLTPLGLQRTIFLRQEQQTECQQPWAARQRKVSEPQKPPVTQLPATLETRVNTNK